MKKSKRIKKRIMILLIILAIIGYLGFVFTNDEIITKDKNTIILITLILYAIFELVYLIRKKSFLEDDISSFKIFMMDNIVIVILSFLASFIAVGFYYAVRGIVRLLSNFGNFMLIVDNEIAELLSGAIQLIKENKIVMAVFLVVVWIIMMKYVIYIVFIKKRR